MSVCFYSKTNQMHNISNLFYFGTTLYMFRTISPSIIRSLRLCIQHVIQVLWLQAATEPVWQSVCTVLDSWWWTERLSETCRLSFQNKINLRYCASGWFYYRNILRCTVPQTSNISICCDFWILTSGHIIGWHCSRNVFIFHEDGPLSDETCRSVTVWIKWFEHILVD